MPECRWLDDGETLTYLHAAVSTNRHRVRVPETLMHLDALLADQPLAGGLEPRLGEQHLRVLTVVGFPTATTPGLLGEMNRLAFPYRWSTRAILMDKTDAARLLTRIRRQWFAKRKSIAAILKEVMTNEQSALVDTDAANKAADADMAPQELGSDVAGMAYVTATVTVWDADPRVADEKLRLVEKVIQGRDFTAMPETINAVDAWLGFCAKCGGAMTLRTGQGSTGATYRYYTCSTKARQGKTGCKGRTIPMDKLDHLVADHIEDRLLQPKRLESILASVIDRRQIRP